MEEGKERKEGKLKKEEEGGNKREGTGIRRVAKRRKI